MNTFDIASQIETAVNQALIIFQSFTDADWRYRRAPDKWSRIEILGHLIDSAANNHQRFVRGQFASSGALVIGYEQDNWVSVQHYAEADPAILTALWANYNLHLASVIRHLDAASDPVIATPGGFEAPLSWWAADYPQHLQHHLAQIMESFVP